MMLRLGGTVANGTLRCARLAIPSCCANAATIKRLRGSRREKETEKPPITSEEFSARIFRTKDLEGHQKLLAEAQKAGCADARVYSTMVESLCRSQRPVAALRVLEEMEGHGFHSELPYKAFVATYGVYHSTRITNEALGSLRQKKIQPLPTTYVALINIFLLCNKKLAVELVNEMNATKVPLDLRTYEILCVSFEHYKMLSSVESTLWQCRSDLDSEKKLAPEHKSYKKDYLRQRLKDGHQSLLKQV